MKIKHFLALFFAFTYLNSIAQDDMKAFNDKGTIMLNGASSMTFSFADGTPFLLGVRGSYFLADKLALGGSFTYFRLGGIFENSDSAFEIFARYYVVNKLFGQVNYQITDPSLLSLNVGYNIMLSDKVSLEPILNYPLEDFLDPAIQMGITVFLN